LRHKSCGAGFCGFYTVDLFYLRLLFCRNLQNKYVATFSRWFYNNRFIYRTRVFLAPQVLWRRFLRVLYRRFVLPAPLVLQESAKQVRCYLFSNRFLLRCYFFTLVLQMSLFYRTRVLLAPQVLWRRFLRVLYRRFILPAPLVLQESAKQVRRYLFQIAFFYVAILCCYFFLVATFFKSLFFTSLFQIFPFFYIFKVSNVMLRTNPRGPLFVILSSTSPK